jgi:hypothetical protein
MIGIEAKELRKDDVILGVGTVLRCLSGPDAWGEMTFKVKDDDGLWMIKLDEDAYLRIEREGAE